MVQCPRFKINGQHNIYKSHEFSPHARDQLNTARSDVECDVVLILKPAVLPKRELGAPRLAIHVDHLSHPCNGLESSETHRRWQQQNSPGLVCLKPYICVHTQGRKIVHLFVLRTVWVHIVVCTYNHANRLKPELIKINLALRSRQTTPGGSTHFYLTCSLWTGSLGSVWMFASYAILSMSCRPLSGQPSHGCHRAHPGGESCCGVSPLLSCRFRSAPASSSCLHTWATSVNTGHIHNRKQIGTSIWNSPDSCWDMSCFGLQPTMPHQSSVSYLGHLLGMCKQSSIMHDNSLS